MIKGLKNNTKVCEKVNLFYPSKRRFSDLFTDSEKKKKNIYIWNKVMTAECCSANEQVDNDPISGS